MKRLWVLAAKFVTAWSSLYILFGWTRNLNGMDITWISLLLVAISYVIGEWMILPRANNTVASAADFGLAALLIGWIVNHMYGLDLTWTNLGMILAASLFIAVGEWFIHYYYQRQLLHRPT